MPRRRARLAPEVVLRHVRAACLALPEVTERLSHGSPTFFVREKGPSFVTFVNDHHGDGNVGIWCAAPPGAGELVDIEPKRFFRPPYVGGRGWLGVRLDLDPDWDELAGVVTDAYRAVAPKRLVALLDAAG